MFLLKNKTKKNYLPGNKSGDIFIIGNSEERKDISHLITEQDIVVRFNQPNPSCNLVADVLFISNNAKLIVHLTSINNGLLSKEGLIIWRHTVSELLLSRFENPSFSRKLRYPFYFPIFRWKNGFNKYPQQYLPISIYRECINITTQLPSSGFIAAYLYSNYFPDRKIYLHNFTFEGWDGHNWSLEAEYIQRKTESNELIIL